MIPIYIAQKVDSKTFALLVIYNIVLSIYNTFSFLGHETLLIRNLLHWRALNKPKTINITITKALFSRAICCLVLTIPVFVYLLFISHIKFDDKNLILLSTFMIAGFFSALNVSSGLILRAFNKYVQSYLVINVSNLIGRLIAVFTLKDFGFIGFLTILIVSPIITFLPTLIYLRQHFKIRIFLKNWFRDFNKLKHFIGSGYLNYGKLSIDEFLVSIFVPLEYLSVYNLAKKLEMTGKNLVEGFFDPLVQKMVTYKSNLASYNSYQKKLMKIKKLCLLIALVFISFFNIYVDYFIEILKLSKFNSLKIFIILSSWTTFIYMGYKVEANILHLFQDQKKLFYYDLYITLTCLLISIFILSFQYYEVLFLSRVIIQIFCYCFYKSRFSTYECSKFAAK